jgi:large subunit ribosomal protein L21e
MPHSFGYRAHTRTLFKKAFRTKGRCPTTTYLRNFKRGDYVDIKVDASVHKGMPFKFYHGRTGVVFNVNKRAIGVEVNKEVRRNEN